MCEGTVGEEANRSHTGCRRETPPHRLVSYSWTQYRSFNGNYTIRNMWRPNELPRRTTCTFQQGWTHSRLASMTVPNPPAGRHLRFSDSHQAWALKHPLQEAPSKHNGVWTQRTWLQLDWLWGLFGVWGDEIPPSHIPWLSIMQDCGCRGERLHRIYAMFPLRSRCASAQSAGQSWSTPPPSVPGSRKPAMVQHTTECSL